jgi:PiT family inorganic phosphate transporter
VGGIFGVGFLREYLASTDQEEFIEKEQISIEDEKKLLNAYTSELKTIEDKTDKSKADYERIVDLYKAIDHEEENIKAKKKHIKSVEKIKYVKRDAVKKIIAAWVITVPATAVLSAAIFFMIRGMVL